MMNRQSSATISTRSACLIPIEIHVHASEIVARSQKRFVSNRLGIAVQLCFLRHPGWAWTPEERIPATMLRLIAAQVSADPSDIESYAKRDPTRREHFLELLQEYSWQSFGLHEYREMSVWLMNQARSTDLGMALITLLISELRHRRIVVPVLPVLERLTIAARSRGSSNFIAR